MFQGVTATSWERFWRKVMLKVFQEFNLKQGWGPLQQKGSDNYTCLRGPCGQLTQEQEGPQSSGLTAGRRGAHQTLEEDRLPVKRLIHYY